jgi:hypothetical protein
MCEIVHPDPVTTEPKRGSLKKVGIVAAMIALALVALGTFTRHRSDSQLASWTTAQSTPIVTVIRPTAEGESDALTLPGNVQARGLLGETRAALLASISVGAGGGRSRLSAGRPLSPGNAATYNNLSVGASLAYELDVFGRVRNSVRADAASAQASAQDVVAVRLGLQASLADSYFQMRGLDARTVLLRQTVAAFQRAYDLTDTRHTGGIASGIDVSRSAALLSSARAELSAVAGARAAFEHAIAALVGETPSTFAIPVADTLQRPPAIPVGVPSTLLQRRPTSSRPSAGSPPPMPRSVSHAQHNTRRSRSAGRAGSRRATATSCVPRTASGHWGRYLPRSRSSTAVQGGPASASAARNMTRRRRPTARPSSPPSAKSRTISPARVPWWIKNATSWPQLARPNARATSR